MTIGESSFFLGNAYGDMLGGKVRYFCQWINLIFDVARDALMFHICESFLTQL
jgi:hypothetical protein